MVLPNPADLGGGVEVYLKRTFMGCEKTRRLLTDLKTDPEPYHALEEWDKGPG